MATRGALLGLLIFSAAIVASGCGRGESEARGTKPAEEAQAGPYISSPLVGFWRAPGRSLEFMPDGIMIETEETTVKATRRREDGTREEFSAPETILFVGTWRPLEAGAIAYELVRVRGFQTRSGSFTFSLGASGKELSILEGGTAKTYSRDRISLPKDEERLLGLWRRLGSLTSDYVDMGLLFTRGGFAVVVGKNSPWESGQGSGSIGWLCAFQRYSVEGPGRLREVREDPLSRLERTRNFELQGNRLVFARDGRQGHVYERVKGPIPFRGNQLDVSAWDALR